MRPRILCDWTPGADRSVPLPSYATSGSAGADLRANLPQELRQGGLTIPPGARIAVPTGLCLAIPEGWEGQVRMRSGLARRTGLCIPNAPGTIDSDFRGEVMVLLWNAGDDPVTLAHGERIAQLVVAPVARADFVPGRPEPTARGTGGFGSTGAA
ncbi:deoxyuridine 5'-triphosphate nucleotidohydrolase [Rubellimicrobium thermophilum DSM 16684]|uniref:Deoxyuridine 5'-triphosphate nucleotidohydrolase n=1 Tax=Rubellimicrobium thermophilum DSM 16684 TaxID=1123069 RepID=S9S300_9RHOB|nr:dUTP diphosphatase [Rubellimicrobium thermophilum]EPX84555.1 deoxyuridine 5'-triphosphate nucleotidohydrolase [Rubellimicrobium thermophilum DSM 16684]